MAIPVNPPPLLRIPKKFFDDPQLRPFFEQQKTILFQLWNRTGGTRDDVANYEVISTSSDLVVERFGTLIVVQADTAPVKITLPTVPLADVGGTVAVLIIDATFDTTVEVANIATETILGDTSVIMNALYMSLDYTAITQLLWNPT